MTIWLFVHGTKHLIWLINKQERWILTWLLNIEPVPIAWQHSNTKRHASIWSVHFAVPIFVGFVCTSIRPITGDSVECSINIVEKWHPFNNCDHHLLIILSWLHNIWNKKPWKGFTELESSNFNFSGFDHNAHINLIKKSIMTLSTCLRWSLIYQ